jgi:hypothetical protein
MTTEVSALVLFLVGAWLPLGSHAVALVVGAVAVLLWAKQRLHELVARTTAEDLHALMQFVLIALVILPTLPDRPFGPYAVLNPREIWLFVVLVVGVRPDLQGRRGAGPRVASLRPRGDAVVRSGGADGDRAARLLALRASRGAGTGTHHSGGAGSTRPVSRGAEDPRRHAREVPREAEVEGDANPLFQCPPLRCHTWAVRGPSTTVPS